MNKFIRASSILPTADILTDDTLKQIAWLGFTSSTTIADIVAAGYALLPEPSDAPSEGDILVADNGPDNVLISKWCSQTDYTNIVNGRQLESIVRMKRNLLLSETDWTQGKDIPDTTSNKWVAYRQALRDITAQAGYPANIQWPQQPV